MSQVKKFLIILGVLFLTGYYIFPATPRRVSPLEEQEALKKSEALQAKFSAERCLSDLTKACLSMLKEMHEIQDALPETYRTPISTILTSCRFAEDQANDTSLNLTPRPKFNCRHTMP